MDDTVFDLFSEIADAPGEIFDIPEMNDRKFDVEEYINSNTDYWSCLSLTNTLIHTNLMTRSQAFFILSSATNGNELLALLDDIQNGCY